MTPMLEEKRRMRITRKKRKRLQQPEDLKGRQAAKYSQGLEVAIHANNKASLSSLATGIKAIIMTCGESAQNKIKK